MKNICKPTKFIVLFISVLATISCSKDNDDTLLPVTLNGTKWTLKGFVLVDKITNALAGTTVNLEFKANGKIEGKAGCNDYTGTYTVSGSNITITADAITFINCEQNINTQEASFMSKLKKSKTFKVDGAKLSLNETDTKNALLFNVS